MGTYEKLMTTCVRIMQEDYKDDPPVKNQVASLLERYTSREDLQELERVLCNHWSVELDGWTASKVLNLAMQTLDSPQVRSALVDLGGHIDKAIQYG